MPRKTTAEELGIAIGTVVKVDKDGRTYTAVTPAGTNVADKIDSYALKNALRANRALRLEETKTGGTSWRQVAPVEFDKVVRGEAVANLDISTVNIAGDTEYEYFDTHEELVTFIADAMNIKPKKLRISDIWWKAAVRNVLRGQNLLVVGPTGCGKTLLANSLKVALGREDRFFYINLGAAQDPRSTLIGNVHYDKEKGTFTSLAYFIRAITTPDAIILLDEISRDRSGEAWNILMSVLDESQRYLRIDEHPDTPTIKVASGVSFILTANVGSEYTATRTMDRALLDRCSIIEMQPLSKDDELANLTDTFPEVETQTLDAIASIASKTRTEIKAETPRIETIISTRMAESWAKACYDGFTLAEAAELYVYPWYSDEGGTASSRSWLKSAVQAHFESMNKTKTPFRGGNPNQAQLPWQKKTP